MAANINGLIYYKLDANVHGYPGDITKNCGLRGEEIDGNFNFLRGNDIKEISFDDDGTIYLKRYNGEIMSAKQVDTPEYDFNYNPESGSLTIVTPDGKEIVLSGFKVTTNVYHNHTLDGYGSQETPLEVSNITQPGRYKPAIRLIDTVSKDENGNSESLPLLNNTKHDRYVTKEKISRFGRLYPLSGVNSISERLNAINSEWHVPSKEEWDEILNEIDCAKPTHSKTESNVELGEFAGTELKATKYWDTTGGEMIAEDTFGFGVYPVGYCGNRGKDYYGSFGRSTAFWTSTIEDNHNDMYVKKFEFDKETVGQQTWGNNYYLSLRLVKKFTGDNFNESETIDGFTVNCVHIPGTSLIWTKENIAFSQPQYDGFEPKKWEEFENIEEDENSYVIRYYVNDWNGNGWDKHEIKEGEAIVLYEGDNGRMHEWLLVNGELIDSAVLIKTEFQEEINFIHSRIDKETQDREDNDKLLWEGLNKESEARTEVDNQLWGAIDNERIAREEVDTQLWGGIAKESESRTEVDNQLWNAIKQEQEARENVDNQQWTAISNLGQALSHETTDRVDSDTKIYENIVKETTDRIEVDRQIWDSLNKEREERKETDKVLQDNINQEAIEREDTDADLQKQINENKVTPEDNSVIIVDGKTVEGKTLHTTIKVNIDNTCEHLKLEENGIYFDGYFGQF